MPPDDKAPAPAPAAAAATVPAAAPAAPAAAAPAPAAEPAKLEENILGTEAKAAPAVSLDDAKKYLTDKGAKADELAKLDEAGVRAKYDEAKKAEAPAAKDGEVVVDFKVPDTIKFSDEQLTDFKGILADAKLTPSERAQKLVDLHAAAAQASYDAQVKLWNDTQADWQKKFKADPEMGGANYDANRAAMSKAIDALLPDPNEAKALREAFNFTGAGNHPAVGRLLLRMSALLNEGGLTHGKPTGETTNKSAAQTLYPDHA